jgi:hypothetical protein
MAMVLGVRAAVRWLVAGGMVALAGCAGGGARERAEAPFDAREVYPSGQDEAVNTEVRARLGREVNLAMSGQHHLDDDLRILEEQVGVKIVVDWQALEHAGVRRDAAATVNLRRVPAEKALKELLAEAGGAQVALRYVVEDGVVKVSTVEALDNRGPQFVRVFDVRDMIEPLQTRVEFPARGERVTKLGKKEGAEQRAEVVKEILGTIEEIVAPDTWVDNGGTVGTIREERGQLVVRQTGQNMKAVGLLLEQLRETRRVNIDLEQRVLLVTREGYAALGAGRGTVSISGKEGRIDDGAGWAAAMKAVEEKGGAVEVGAPRMQLRNGEAAGLRIGGERVPGGMAMGVQATASADRKFVVLGLVAGMGSDTGEKPVLVSLPADATLALFMGKVAGKEDRWAVWMVRGQVVVERAQAAR